MPATSLDDLSIPLVDAIALLVGPRRANLRNLGRVAHRYLKPAQKALLHSIKLVPGAQLESLTAFIRVLPWAAHSIHRLIMPSRPQEIPYISGRAGYWQRAIVKMRWDSHYMRTTDRSERRRESQR